MSRPDANPRAIIAEDEEVLREQLREQLSALWPELSIIAEAEDGIAALRALEADAPDILFLDIQMPELSGLEVAHQASGRCHVVFVTAYNQYAIAAFEEGAVDYVMKPFSPARLATTSLPHLPYPGSWHWRPRTCCRGRRVPPTTRSRAGDSVPRSFSRSWAGNDSIPRGRAGHRDIPRRSWRRSDAIAPLRPIRARRCRACRRRAHRCEAN